MSESAGSKGEAGQCIGCGDGIEGDGIYNGNRLKPDAGEKLDGGESVPVTDVIEFNDGPYCSLECSIRSETDQEASDD